MNQVQEWFKSNIFNLISMVVLVSGSFWVTNERVIRLEERVKSASDRSDSIEKKLDEMRQDLKDLGNKQDDALKYLIELSSKK